MTTNGLHRRLCERAGEWLQSTIGCQVVAVEHRPGYGECPDAIGFRMDDSFLVEVKVSRRDFLADMKKIHRRHSSGMGTYRWYLTPPQLLSPTELPEDWGLLETDGGRVKVIRGRFGPRPLPHWSQSQGCLIEPKPPKTGYAVKHDPDIAAERRMLVSIARGLALRPDRTLSHGTEGPVGADSRQ